MPANTSNRSYPYPLSTDDPDIPSDMQALAVALDTDVALFLKQLFIPAVPISTSSNGTSTSGTTETLDAVLGTYSFTALAGVRYRAMLTNIMLFGTSTAVGDRYTINIRNGGNTTPSSSSTLVATLNVIIDGSGGGFTGDVGHVVSGTFMPGAGTVTLGVFVVRVSGTGTIVPTFNRELCAQPIGLV
jgi:hypothetical protein